MESCIKAKETILWNSLKALMIVEIKGVNHLITIWYFGYVDSWIVKRCIKAIQIKEEREMGFSLKQW